MNGKDSHGIQGSRDVTLILCPETGRRNDGAEDVVAEASGSGCGVFAEPAI